MLYTKPYFRFVEDVGESVFGSDISLSHRIDIPCYTHIFISSLKEGTNMFLKVWNTHVKV